MPLPAHAVIDLFCGIGGLTCGMKSAGLNVVAGVDFDDSCKYAFEQNNQSTFLHKDVTALDHQELAQLYPEGAIKILVGCAPCQPFSNVPGKREDKEGKWQLLYAFAQLIEQINPDIISMENVPALKSHKKGKVLKDFIERLQLLGYSVTKKCVNAANYGVPQRRYRLILLASKRGKIKLVPKTNDNDNAITVADAIGDLAPLISGEVDAKDALHRCRKLSPINMRRIQATSEGGTWLEWPAELLEGLECRKTDVGKEFTSAYGRMSWNKPAPTLTTNCIGLSNGCYGHPSQDRAISLREAALLQSFPANYKFIESERRINIASLSRHIGNAVPPKLGEAIANSIINHLNETSRNVG